MISFKNVFCQFMLAVVSLAMFSYPVDAQKKSKITIGIAPFDFQEKNYKQSASELQDIIVSVFSSNNEFELLDRSKVSQIQKELKTQKGREYTLGKTVKQNEARGAEMLILGTLVGIDTQRVGIAGKLPIGGSGSSDKLTITYSLQAVDVRTGVLKGSRSFIIKGSYGKDMSVGGVTTQSGSAVRSNRETIMNDVSEWLNTIFPPRLIIDTINKRNKNGTPGIITIISSHKFHVKENAILAINEVTEHQVEGERKTKVEKIAELKIVELQGDYLKCEVVDGADILEDKLTHSRDKLFIQLTDKKTSVNPFKKRS